MTGVTFAAQERARALLCAHLDDTQRRDLYKTGHFDVDGYTIRLDTNAISVFAASGSGGSYCIEVVGCWDLPAADSALAMFLFIRADPSAFRQTVNRDRAWPRDYLPWPHR